MINILDLGTGSGCILLSILKELNFSRGTGIDISSKNILKAETAALSAIAIVNYHLNLSWILKLHQVDTSNKLIRPLSKYSGEKHRKVMLLNQR